MYIVTDISVARLTDTEFRYFIADTEASSDDYIHLHADEVRKWLAEGTVIKGLSSDTCTPEEFRRLVTRDNSRRLAVGQNGVYTVKRLEVGGIMLTRLKFTGNEYVYRLPNFVTYLHYGFANCGKTSVKAGKLIVPENVLGMADGAFSQLSYAQIVDLSKSSIISLSKNGFLYADNLSTVILPEGLLRIGESAFRHSSIRNIEIPDKVDYVGIKAFYHCEELKKIKWGRSLRYISDMCFKYTPMSVIVVPDWVTTIGAQAFYNTECETLVVGYSVSSVDATAIYAGGLDRLVFLGGEDNFKACSWMFTSINNLHAVHGGDRKLQIYYWRKHKDAFVHCINRLIIGRDNFEVFYLDDVPNVDSWLQELREKSIIQE